MGVPKFSESRGATIPRIAISVQPVQGFTLLELLVVMVIIGLLAGYVGPKYFSQIGKSEVKMARAQIDALDKALDQYRLDTGHYPTMEQGWLRWSRARQTNPNGTGRT